MLYDIFELSNMLYNVLYGHVISCSNRLNIPLLTRYNMLYDMFERFAPTLNTKSEVEKKKNFRSSPPEVFL